MTKILTWLLASAVMIILLATGFYLFQLVDLQEFARIEKISEIDQSIAQIDLSNERQILNAWAEDTTNILKKSPTEAQIALEASKKRLVTEVAFLARLKIFNSTPTKRRPEYGVYCSR